MNKTYFVLISIMVSTLIGTMVIAQDGAGAARYRLSFRDDPSTTIVIGWDQVSGADATVHYGTVDEGTVSANYTSTHGIDRNDDSHGMATKFARLTGLTPNTNYYFVLDNGSPGVRYWFKTQPATADSISIVAGGDTRSGTAVRQKGFTLVQKLSPNFVYFGGDYTNTASDAQWKEWLDHWQLTTRADGKMIPIVGATGNHEGTLDVQRIFDTPDPDGGTDGEYYALSFGGDLLRTYVLNTQGTQGGSQGTWLGTDLAANQAFTYRTAILHAPLRSHTAYKDDNNGGYNAWAQHFYDYKVQLIVESDAHNVKATKRIKPCSSGVGCDEGYVEDPLNGNTYVGEGTWGAPLYQDEDSKSWTKCYGEFNQFKWVFVSPDEIKVQTINISASNSAVAVTDDDRFTTPSGLTVWDCDGGAVIIPSPNGGPLTIFGSATNEICYGDYIGEASVTIFNGTAPYDYVWSNGDSGDDVVSETWSTTTDLTQGTYTVTVTDNIGTTQTASVTVGGPNMIVITETITEASDCISSCDGAINITATGDYVGAQNNITITSANNDWGAEHPADNDCSGDYYFDAGTPSIGGVIDENTINEICISVTHPDVSQLNIGISLENSAGNFLTMDLIADQTLSGSNITNACFSINGTANITTGTAPYTGSWAPYASQDFSANGFKFDNGKFDVDQTWYISVTDCAAGQTGTIDFLSVTFNGATNTTSYLWSDGSTTEDASGLCSGIYTITVSDNNSCTQSKAFAVTCPNSLDDLPEIEDRVIVEKPGRLRVQTAKSIKSVEVFTASGKVVYKGGARTRIVDLSRERTGVYLVRVRTDEGDFVQKVLLSK